MKKVIWKFPISIHTTSIRIPIGSDILSIQVQGNIPCIWALVDPEMEKETTFIDVIGTGQEFRTLSINRKFIGTIQLGGGALVYHIFEQLKH